MRRSVKRFLIGHVGVLALGLVMLVPLTRWRDEPLWPNVLVLVVGFEVLNAVFWLMDRRAARKAGLR